MLSHGDPAEGVCDGADEDDRGEKRAEETDHGVEDPLPAESGLTEQDLLLNAAHTGDPRDEQADGNGRDGHHDGVFVARLIQQVRFSDVLF